MKPASHSRIVVFLGLLMAVPLALARPSPAKQSPAVTVTYANPKSFTEMRLAPGSMRSDADSNIALLKRHIIKRATRLLAPGQRLEVTVTDLKLAGQYQPWNQAPSGWMRVIKQPYAPRMDFAFTLRGANGKVIAKGKRTLVDPGFMNGMNAQDSNPVRYTEAMFVRWLRREIKGH